MASGYHSTLQGTSTRTGTTTPTSFPASMVAFSFCPSSEPEATMALSMSPVARWQTQKFLANLGACRGGKNPKIQLALQALESDFLGVNLVPAAYRLCEVWQMPISLPVTGIKVLYIIF